MQLSEAHKAVATTLKSLGIKPARGRFPTITGRIIRGWCEQVASDVGRHSEAAQTHDLLLNDPRGNIGTDLAPERAQALLLERLAAVARRMRAHEGP
jgi:hypothetical protein